MFHQCLCAVSEIICQDKKILAFSPGRPESHSNAGEPRLAESGKLSFPFVVQPGLGMGRVFHIFRHGDIVINGIDLTGIAQKFKSQNLDCQRKFLCHTAAFEGHFSGVDSGFSSRRNFDRQPEAQITSFFE